jgi:hypothetical protein
MVSSIDGQVLPIALCDNCSRVIKYVAIYGARSESFNLVEMRILDINVVADLTRPSPSPPNPNSPAKYDGTHSGSIDENIRHNVDVKFEEANQYVQCYWTGPWPVLHLVINWVLSGAWVTLHFTFDYLQGLYLDPSSEMSLLVPLLAANGYTGQAAQDKIVHAANKVASDPQLVYAWNAVHTAALATFLLGFVSGLCWLATAVYIGVFVDLVVFCGSAIAVELSRVKSGAKDRADAALAIVTEGALQIICGGLVDTWHMLARFSQAEKALADLSYGYPIVPWNEMHDAAAESCCTAISLYMLGFAIIYYGYLLGLGLIPI